jgi:hypothetical protein
MGCQFRVPRMEWILCNAIFYVSACWWTSVRLEKGSSGLERKIKNCLKLFFYLFIFLVGYRFYQSASPYFISSKSKDIFSAKSSQQEPRYLDIIDSNNRLEDLSKFDFVVLHNLFKDKQFYIEKYKDYNLQFFGENLDPISNYSYGVVLFNKKINQSKIIPLDSEANNGYIIELENLKLKVAVCFIDKFNNSSATDAARILLRRLATQMRHSPYNWYVSCNIPTSIFSKKYLKFLEATNGATDKLTLLGFKGFLHRIYLNLQSKYIYQLIKQSS